MAISRRPAAKPSTKNTVIHQKAKLHGMPLKKFAAFVSAEYGIDFPEGSWDAAWRVKFERMLAEWVGTPADKAESRRRSRTCPTCHKPIIPANSIVGVDVYSVCETCPECSARMCGYIVCPCCAFDTAR